MTNSKRDYNEFIRANLPYGIEYDSARYQYVTFNGKRFVTYLEAKWYIDYLTKFGGGPEDDIRNDLFGASEQGGWFEANDSTTLFTDVAGTTPVTTPGDAVALQLDKSGRGNHRTQATTAARPLYALHPVGGVRNILTNTEEFDTRTVQVTPGEEYTLSFVSGESVVDLDETIASTAVDVFVYDTSKDSDGGAWRTGALAQASSWYNETLNTATRGSRREFPAVAVIVAESDNVTIYDGDDPSLPMWMVFNQTSAVSAPFDIWRENRAASSVTALNGIIFLGINNSTVSGIASFSFVGDLMTRISTTENIGKNQIANRNTNAGFFNTGDAARIVDLRVYDVAITVLPDAPIDPATGLPVPTIAVATAGGVSVIKDDGTVVDSADTASMVAVDFNPENILAFTRGGNTNRIAETYDADGFGSDDLYTVVEGYIPNGTTDLVYSSVERVRSGGVGLERLHLDTSALAGSLHSFTTSTYNTGWLPGDIKGAFLSDTDDTDLVGGTDADRSVNGNDLTVNGTITRIPVATGADLVGYSGFSSSNYLEQPYNSDLDFGTGDFCVMGWVNGAGGNDLLDRSDGSNTFRFKFTSDKIRVNIAGVNLDTPSTFTGGWKHVVYVRKSGVGYIYGNGALLVSGSHSGNVGSGMPTRVGNRYDGTAPFEGSMALWRISATAPKPEQIAKIYNDEKVLFQENAQATLYGASDAVTALAHDPDTDLLHVGTSAGRSVFNGLLRVNNTTTGVTTAISAANGVIGEQ